MLFSALKGMVVGVLVTLVLSLIFTAIALAFDDPKSVVDLLSYAALAISALFVGIIAVKSDGEHRVTASLIGGIMYVILLFIISLFMSGEGVPSPILRAVAWALSIGVCMLGGLMGKGRRVRVGEGKNSPTELARRKLAKRK